MADDEKPKLEMVEENDGPRVSVKSLDERTSSSSSSSGSGSSGSGSGSSGDSSSSSSGFSRASFTSSFEKVRLEALKASMASSQSEEEEAARELAKKAPAATFGMLRIEDLKGRMQDTNQGMKSWDDLPKRTEDLNGINPLTTILFSIFPALCSFLGYKASTWLTANFAVEFLTSDLYPVQRFAIVVRNLVVGITSLATGFCGVISIGLFAMGCVVAIGVVKGELDPSAENASGNVK